MRWHCYQVMSHTHTWACKGLTFLPKLYCEADQSSSCQFTCSLSFTNSFLSGLSPLNLLYIFMYVMLKKIKYVNNSMNPTGGGRGGLSMVKSLQSWHSDHHPSSPSCTYSVLEPVLDLAFRPACFHVLWLTWVLVEVEVPCQLNKLTALMECWK